MSHRESLLLIPFSVLAVCVLLILVLSRVNIVVAAPLPEEAPLPEATPDPGEFIVPYKNYTITQGPHGQSYGHLAIDLAAGKGSKIRSPINGEVTELFTDGYGNPTLVIENSKYRVTLLHGNYIVHIGEQLTIGQKIGTESNQGYTTDMQGNSCAGRDCGYHTHLNVYDKQLGVNINPLNLFP